MNILVLFSQRFYMEVPDYYSGFCFSFNVFGPKIFRVPIQLTTETPGCTVQERRNNVFTYEKFC